MSVHLRHPAWNNRKIADMGNWKDRRPTLEQIKEQQRLKRLKKKRKRGG